MKWYAETGPLRTRQLLADVLVALWVLLWLRIGLAVDDAVRRLGAPGRELEEAGNGLSGGLNGADPVGRWRRGEPGAAEALAALELRAQGLRVG